MGFGMANTLTEQQLLDFGWRIAFLAGAVIVPFGLAIRRRLPETLHAADVAKRERISLRPHLPVAVIGLLLLASATIGTYILGYMTTYAIATLHMPGNVAFAATVVVGLCGFSWIL
jgi:MFS transporter, MHS family, citrate/tricarballylate:H+ symporter